MPGHGPVWERARHWVRQAYPDGSMSPISILLGLLVPAVIRPNAPSELACGLVAPRCRCPAWLPSNMTGDLAADFLPQFSRFKRRLQTGRSQFVSHLAVESTAFLRAIHDSPTALHPPSTHRIPPVNRRAIGSVEGRCCCCAHGPDCNRPSFLIRSTPRIRRVPVGFRRWSAVRPEEPRQSPCRRTWRGDWGHGTRRQTHSRICHDSIRRTSRHLGLLALQIGAWMSAHASAAGRLVSPLPPRL